MKVFLFIVVVLSIYVMCGTQFYGVNTSSVVLKFYGCSYIVPELIIHYTLNSIKQVVAEELETSN